MTETTTTSAVPGEVLGWIDQVRYEEQGEFPVERGYIWTVAASVENGNPLYWDDEVAAEVTGGPIAPPTMISQPSSMASAIRRAISADCNPRRRKRGIVLAFSRYASFPSTNIIACPAGSPSRYARYMR